MFACTLQCNLGTCENSIPQELHIPFYALLMKRIISHYVSVLWHAAHMHPQVPQSLKDYFWGAHVADIHPHERAELMMKRV